MIVPWPVEQNGKVVPLIGRKGKPNYILEKPKVLHLGVNLGICKKISSAFKIIPSKILCDPMHNQ